MSADMLPGVRERFLDHVASAPCAMVGLVLDQYCLPDERQVLQWLAAQPDTQRHAPALLSVAQHTCCEFVAGDGFTRAALEAVGAVWERLTPDQQQWVTASPALCASWCLLWPDSARAAGILAPEAAQTAADGTSTAADGTSSTSCHLCVSSPTHRDERVWIRRLRLDAAARVHRAPWVATLAAPSHLMRRVEDSAGPGMQMGELVYRSPAVQADADERAARADAAMALAAPLLRDGGETVAQCVACGGALEADWDPSGEGAWRWVGGVAQGIDGQWWLESRPCSLDAVTLWHSACVPPAERRRWLASPSPSP